MEKWFVMRKGAPFQEISEKFHIHPILARLIRNRDVVGDENIEFYLHGTILRWSADCRSRNTHGA